MIKISTTLTRSENADELGIVSATLTSWLLVKVLILVTVDRHFFYRRKIPTDPSNRDLLVVNSKLLIRIYRMIDLYFEVCAAATINVLASKLHVMDNWSSSLSLAFHCCSLTNWQTMIESGLSLPDLRDVEEYHDERKLAKMSRTFRAYQRGVSKFITIYMLNAHIEGIKVPKSNSQLS